MNHAHGHPDPRREPRGLPLWLGFGLFLAVAAFLLWGEHRVHLLGALPYVLLLLCPLIHFFSHRGHGGHGDHPGRAQGPRDGLR